MNILFLSQRLPGPPNKGDKIRSHHLARRLAAHHAVHVACLLDEPSEASDAEEVSRWAASVTWRLRRTTESAVRGAASALTGRPMTVGFFRSGGLAGDVRALRRKIRFDVVVSYCSSMAGYVDGWTGPKVLDLVDVDSEKWRQYAERTGLPRRVLYSLEHRLLRRYERRLVGEFHRCVLVSEKERKILSRFASPERVAVVANGVDTEWLDRRDRPNGKRSLVFVGALDYFANEEGIVHFARETFPRIRRQVPGVTLRVVGRRPGPAVCGLGRAEGVEVVGEVDDVRPELWWAAVAVVPLRIAQGLQNKVLEAMAAETPVVSTPAAVGGVGGRPGEHYRVGGTPEEFAAEVVRLLEDPAAARAQADRARELVLREYSWDRKACEYEAVLDEAVAEAGVLPGAARRAS